MILLWGVPGDGPLDAVRACLHQLGADVRLLDQRRASGCTAELSVDRSDVALTIEGRDPSDRIDFRSVSAAYLRPVETARAQPEDGGDLSRARAERVDRAIVTWADLTSTLVVNPPAAMAVNNSKPFQLQAISEFGLAVPDTLITTDPSAVHEFARHHGRIIYKSISGVRSIVSQVDEDALRRLDDVANAPTQFQEFVSGLDVRVHVVGREIFATEARSDADDYRYASLSGADVALAPIEIPDQVADRCRAMAAGMDLAVAGIDLRRTASDEWVCFEVNPSPAFVFYEEATGQPIGAAIARLLLNADRSHACGSTRRALSGLTTSGGGSRALW